MKTMATSDGDGLELVGKVSSGKYVTFLDRFRIASIGESKYG